MFTVSFIIVSQSGASASVPAAAFTPLSPEKLTLLCQVQIIIYSLTLNMASTTAEGETRAETEEPSRAEPSFLLPQLPLSIGSGVKVII